jgi:hypothetical protein
MERVAYELAEESFEQMFSESLATVADTLAGC